MQGHCRDCKYWQTEDEDVYDGKHHCVMADTRESLLHATYDDSGVLTAADFGCVMFEAEED